MEHVVCRYAHRVAGTHGRRVQLVVVRAALGTQQVLSVRPPSALRALEMGRYERWAVQLMVLDRSSAQ
jgi:hypothetical protein